MYDGRDEGEKSYKNHEEIDERKQVMSKMNREIVV
jgi:hypothetical protein